MRDYILRSKALDIVKRTSGDYATAFCEIAHLPAADVRLVVRGRWAHLGGDEWCCTACGNVIHTEGSWEKPEKKFCEDCGADMRPENDE